MHHLYYQNMQTQNPSLYYAWQNSSISQVEIPGLITSRRPSNIVARRCPEACIPLSSLIDLIVIKIISPLKIYSSLL